MRSTCVHLHARSLLITRLIDHPQHPQNFTTVLGMITFTLEYFIMVWRLKCCRIECQVTALISSALVQDTLQFYSFFLIIIIHYSFIFLLLLCTIIRLRSGDVSSLKLMNQQKIVRQSTQSDISSLSNLLFLHEDRKKQT